MTDIYGEFEQSRIFNQERMDRRSADALVGLAAGIIGLYLRRRGVFLRNGTD